jgi:DNA repair protein SbcD/Mre11
MRIIHTSDWHLGRSFGPVSLRNDQERFCDWLVETVRDERIDLVVIAGDVYDRAIAPVEAIELFRTTLRRIHETGSVVAVISGNHDGADRVAPYDDLLDASGVFVRGGYEGVGRVITHTFDDGPLDLVLLPFLEPQGAPDHFLPPEPADGPDQAAEPVVQRRRRQTHASVLEHAISRAHGGLGGGRSLAVAHAFVTGGAVSESERQLEVGGTGDVAASLFDGFSYVALGHLHRPQQVGRPTLRYSGTPLAYSFSESHDKSVTLIDMAADGTCQVHDIPVPVGRRVVTLNGTMDHLLSPGAHPGAADCFVRAIVTDRETVLDAKAKLEAVYPFVVEIQLQPEGGPISAADVERPDMGKLPPEEAARAFWEAVEGSPPDTATDAVLLDAVTAATAGGVR